MEGEDPWRSRRSIKRSNIPGQWRLLAINDIGDYWPTSPPKKHIHILVESPASTAISSREQELLDRIASLEETLNKSAYGRYKVVERVERLRGVNFSPDIALQTLTLLWVRDRPNHSSGQWILNMWHSKASKITYMKCTLYPSGLLNMWHFKTSKITYAKCTNC